MKAGQVQLDIRESRVQSLHDTLVNVLKQKQLLIVLDNFEHVAAAAPNVASLLEQASGLKILTTSRAALHVDGEHIWVVPPLPFSDVRTLPTREMLTVYPAVQLFVERAQAVQQDFVLTDELMPVVAAICAQLEGIPLAIELAAARSRILSPPALLERLGQRPALLTDGVANAPERHQSLRAAIAWSYDLLSADEQALLRQLGVFVGGWTLAAAEEVAAFERSNVQRLQPSNLLDVLAALVDKSLVQRLADPDGEPRLTMLETVREFALEQLEASGEVDVVWQQYARYYLQLAETAEPHLHGPNQVAWLQRLETEHGNLRAALAWSQTAACDAELALRLAVALYQFWQVRGYWREGHAWLAAAIARNPQAAPALRAAALARASRLARDQDDYAQATQLAEQSLPLARPANHPQSMILALDTLGGIATVQSNFAQAIQLYKEALMLARQIDDQRLMSDTLVSLGRLARIQADLGRADAFNNEALQISRKVDNAHGVVRALWGLGSVAREQREYRRAGALFEEGLALAQSLGFKTLIAQILNGLAEAARLQQDYAQAAEHYRDSLQLFHELGDKGNVSAVQHNLGFVALPPPPPPDNKAAFVDYQVQVWKILNSPGYPRDEKTIREWVQAGVDRSYEPAGLVRHQTVSLLGIFDGGYRRTNLKTIRVPVVILQGADDPLVPVESARDLAANIPGADLRIIPGLGHDIPIQLVPEFADAISAAATRATGPTTQ